MKRLTLLIPILLALFVFTNQSIAQNVPNAVKQAFNKKFPNAKHVKWENENAEEFEAEFALDGTRMSANFDAQGQWKETETEISTDALPNPVQQTLRRDYPDVTVHHAFKVEQPGQTLYEVETGQGENHEMMEEEEEEHEEQGEENEEEEEMEEQEHEMHELVFTADGKVVHSKKDDDEDEDEDNDDENL